MSSYSWPSRNNIRPLGVNISTNNNWRSIEAKDFTSHGILFELTKITFLETLREGLRF